MKRTKVMFLCALSFTIIFAAQKETKNSLELGLVNNVNEERGCSGRCDDVGRVLAWLVKDCSKKKSSEDLSQNDANNTCLVCFEDLGPMQNQKVIPLAQNATATAKTEHLKHSAQIHKDCMLTWMHESRGGHTCPLCRNELDREEFDNKIQMEIAKENRLDRFITCCAFIYFGCAFIYFAALMWLVPLANLTIPGFVTIEHGFIAILLSFILKDYCVDLHEQDILMPHIRHITPLILNVFFLCQDKNHLWETGSDFFRGEEIPPLRNPEIVSTMILVPTFFKLWRLNDENRSHYPCMTKILKFANYVLPIFTNFDFFSIFYVASWLQKEQETIWLQFLGNVITCVFYPAHNAGWATVIIKMILICVRCLVLLLLLIRK